MPPYMSVSSTGQCVERCIHCRMLSGGAQNASSWCEVSTGKARGWRDAGTLQQHGDLASNSLRGLGFLAPAMGPTTMPKVCHELCRPEHSRMVTSCHHIMAKESA